VSNVNPPPDPFIEAQIARGNRRQKTFFEKSSAGM
jgi:hypothetical protein